MVGKCASPYPFTAIFNVEENAMTISDEIKKDVDKVDKAVHSEDQPMEKKSPGAPFAIVALAYMIVLALALGAIWLVISFLL